MSDLILAFGGRPPTSQPCRTAGVVTSSDVKVCWAQDVGGLAALRPETSTKTPAHPPRSREQLCPQQSPVAPCHPPRPCHPSCLLEGNLPSDPVQAVIHFLRAAEHRAGGPRTWHGGELWFCRDIASCLPAAPLLPGEALGTMAWPGNKGSEDRDMQDPASPGHWLDCAMAPSSQRPELLK